MEPFDRLGGGTVKLYSVPDSLGGGTFTVPLSLGRVTVIFPPSQSVLEEGLVVFPPSLAVLEEGQAPFSPSLSYILLCFLAMQITRIMRISFFGGPLQKVI